MSDNGAWRNRIIGTAEIDPEELLANPKNWRIHPKAQQDALTGALNEMGWIDEVTVNQPTGFVLDGHLRVALALRHHQATVPVKFVDLTEAEETLALASKDPIGTMATADREQLDALLREVQTGDAALQGMLADLAEKNYLNLPAEFPEYNESVADDVEYLECPKCGHKWPK